MLEEWLPYLAIAVAATAAIAGTVFAARHAWRRQVRRYLVGLLGRREAIDASVKAIESTLISLRGGTVAEMVAFAELESEERRTFAEIGDRMEIERGELAALPLPKSLWPLADSLGVAAGALADQAGRVGASSGEDALDALMRMDLSEARATIVRADGYIAELSAVYDLTDPAVYGGGLYI